MKLKWYPENGKRVLLCKRLGNLIQLIRAWNIFSVTWRSMEEPPFVLASLTVSVLQKNFICALKQRETKLK
jgi:hypothetical protein